MVILLASQSTLVSRYEKLKGLTYFTIDRQAIKESYYKIDMSTALEILYLVFGVYAYFSF
jgi:hypothetical protein